ncbi:MAG: hypothetical protein CVV51_01805 [Spirochaetae bacterium HGW-Spirochaetae-7]|jgi:PAS domain S-box-containing protein|nr:MAG: hypothetical protein CVV51_01805 [Spirochaetae bacterium HGW-Spirochaetae-7]
MAAAQGKRTLLLVEDEVIIALAEKMSLEKYGYTVISVYTGEEAIAATEDTYKIDLILMDIDLGKGIDGTETAKMILESHDLPVVFVSSHTEQEIVEKTEKITSYGYVVKNSSITVLDASIKMAFKLFEARKSISQSELKQKTMIANISDVIGILGVDGIMKYASPNVEKWFGWLPEDLVGTDGWLTIHPDDLERIKKVFRVLLGEDNASTMVEYRYVCKDGACRTIELTATNLVNDPVLGGVLLNYHDITGRKQVEENLRTHQIELQMQNDELRDKQADIEALRLRYFDLYDMAPVAYVSLDVTGLIKGANLTAANLLGVTRHDLEKISFSKFIDADDQDIYYLLRKRLFDTGGPQHCELRMLRKDGTVFPAYLKAVKVQEETGATVCRVVVVERERNESLEIRKGDPR